jgi:hypothetical protein
LSSTVANSSSKEQRKSGKELHDDIYIYGYRMRNYKKVWSMMMCVCESTVWECLKCDDLCDEKSANPKLPQKAGTLWWTTCQHIRNKYINVGPRASTFETNI